MALIDGVKLVCDRLAPRGWRDLLRRATGNQLDIAQPTAAKLRTELLKPLTAIDRTQRGFTDFSLDGARAVTPGSPARSLLYHALAAPGVGRELRAFPTLREIEIVEHFVFGAQAPTLAQLRKTAGLGAHEKLVVAVFAYEYRPARDTCSRLQADLAFARTGVARVGTRPALYDPQRRGFRAEVAEEPFAVRVCPARYGAFLAVRRKGSAPDGRPMRAADSDAKRLFWIPIHKLFDGDECIAGLTLEVRYSAFHYNDKIRRIHDEALSKTHKKRAPTSAPFRLTEGIAEISSDPEACHGLVMPAAHPRLVEPALLNGEPVTYRVPKDNGSGFAAFEPDPERMIQGREVRPAPAYIHARTEVRTTDGVSVLIDLNDEPNVLETVAAGGYDALHYMDFTGDGFVRASIPALSNRPEVAKQSVAAYSLVAAPDFFPDAGQRELFEAVPESFWGVPPEPLCDTRLPGNLQMPNSPFAADDETITAIVPLLGPPPGASATPASLDASRHSCLPDDCAGVFAPGWDVSTDVTSVLGKRVNHLAAYGLGSPFPEDSKLCAALGTFWPAVAPDATRGMSPTTGNESLRHTVAPLTDEEIGQAGGLPWDGINGPALVAIDGQDFAECEDFLHVDYVRQALDGRFTLRLTAQISAAEYERRVRAMALVRDAIGGDPNKRFVLSFRKVSPGDAELQHAQADAMAVLRDAYRVDVIRGGADTERLHPTNFRKKLLPIIDRQFFFVDPTNALVLQRPASQSHWSRASPPA